MRKFYFLLVTMFSLNGAFAQWVQQNSGTTNNLHSVYFTDPNYGWVVGDLGTILHTSDGGVNWAPQSSNTTFQLNSVFFIDTDNGYAVGNGIYPVRGNIILKTTDGGLTWADTSYGSQTQEWDLYDLRSIQFTDPSTGYIFGYYNADYEMFILKTTDSGANWNKVLSLGVSAEGWTSGSMFFSGPDTGYFIHTDYNMSTTAAIYKTTDGWKTWVDHLIYHYGRPNLPGLSAGCFPVPDTGYVIGAGGLFKSIDGGVTWTDMGLERAGNSLFFKNANEGWVIQGGDTILYTTNGGDSLTIQNPGTTNDLNSLYFIDENTGYAVGNNGTIVKSTSIVGLSEHHHTENALEVYPNPASNYLTIALGSNNKKVEITITDIAGKIIYSTIARETQNIEVNTKEFAEGVYLVKVQAGDFSATKKLVVEK